MDVAAALPALRRVPLSVAVRFRWQFETHHGRRKVPHRSHPFSSHNRDTGNFGRHCGSAYTKTITMYDKLHDGREYTFLCE